MEETVKNDILSVLRDTNEIMGQCEPDISKLNSVSNHTIHNASIFQDEDSIGVAVLVYSLSKIILRVQNRVDYSKIKNLIETAIEYLEDDNIEAYQDFVSQIFTIITKIDDKFKIYIQQVIRQASINKGSKIYEHGVSASKTAEILGISIWELYSYLGLKDVNEATTVRARLKFTRGLFS